MTPQYSDANAYANGMPIKILCLFLFVEVGLCRIFKGFNRILDYVRRHTILLNPLKILKILLQ